MLIDKLMRIIIIRIPYLVNSAISRHGGPVVLENFKMNEQLTSEIAPVGSGTSWGGFYDPVVGLLQAGGPVVGILLVLSVVALAVILIKLWQFTAEQVGAREFVDKSLVHWRAGQAGAALETLDQSANPIARVMAVAIRGQGRGVAQDTVREEAARVAGSELEKLRSHLRGLEVIGSLSPLLGLLGTVLGMIEAFQQLEAAAGSRVDPGVLSGGIWEALLTTAIGLGVAIPVVAALHGLERTVESVRHGMEDALTRVFTLEMAQPAERVVPVVPQAVVPATQPS